MDVDTDKTESRSLSKIKDKVRASVESDKVGIESGRTPGGINR
jgi:hypothetical protein